MSESQLDDCTCHIGNPLRSAHSRECPHWTPPRIGSEGGIGPHLMASQKRTLHREPELGDVSTRSDDTSTASTQQPEPSEGTPSVGNQVDHQTIVTAGSIPTCIECGAIDYGARQGMNHVAGCRTALHGPAAWNAPAGPFKPWRYDKQTERLYPADRPADEFIGRIEPASGPLAALAPIMANVIVEYCAALEAAGCQPPTGGIPRRLFYVADLIDDTVDEHADL